MKRHDTLLRRDDTLLLVIDYQTKLVNAMKNKDLVTGEINRLMEGMRLLNIPIFMTEQYPKGLGPTVDDITSDFDSKSILEKMTFSCCADETIFKKMKSFQRKQIIATGIETHVCVLQTALDLLANGYQVHVPITATCSRSDENRENAFNRMQQAGAILTNVESILFELLIQAGTDDFKAVRKLMT